MKQNSATANHLSNTNNNYHALLNEKGRSYKYAGRLIKAILIIMLVCSLQNIVYANTNKNNTTSSPKTSVNTTPVFARVLELYSVYSSQSLHDDKQDLFKIREAEEEIENIMKKYNGKSFNVPKYFECEIIANPDYASKGVEIIIDLPFRCYVQPINNDKHIKKIVMNNSTGPFWRGPVYVKCPYKELVSVYGSTTDIKKDWKYYNSAYIKENPYSTKLSIFYLDSKDFLNKLSKNSENVKIQVRVKDVKFSRPKESGFFKLKDLLENNFNTTPLYDNETSFFASKTNDNISDPPYKVLFATIETISIINSRTNTEIVQMNFDPDCQIPDSIKVDNDIDFQYKYPEDLTHETIDNVPTLGSILPKKYFSKGRDEFDSMEMCYKDLCGNNKEEKFKSLIANKVFQRKFCLETVYIPRNFNKNEFRLLIKTPSGFRFEDNVSFDMHNIEKISLSDSEYNAYYSFRQKTYSMIDRGIYNYYFLNFKQQLVPLRNSGYSIESVRIEGGSLYYREEMYTILIMDVVATLEDMKDIYNNHSNYEVIIIYEDLKQVDLPYYGYFNEEALLMLDGNTRLLRALEFSSEKEHTPYYFITYMKNENKYHSDYSIYKAKIQNIYVVNKKTKKIIAKADAKE